MFINAKVINGQNLVANGKKFKKTYRLRRKNDRLRHLRLFCENSDKMNLVNRDDKNNLGDIYMNTKTFQQFDTMTTEALVCIEGGNQVFAGGGGKLKPDQPWWTKVDWCSIASGVNGGMIVC